MTLYNAENAYQLLGGDPKTDIVRVFLDGREIDHVAECDDEKGFVVKYETDENQRFILRGDEYQTTTLFGTVRVDIAPRETQT